MKRSEMTFAASKVLKRKSCEDERRGGGSSSNLGFRTFLIEMLRDLRTTERNDEEKQNSGVRIQKPE
jgi:hypothetical protein